MTEKEKNDLFYVCSLIEFIARKTNNKRGYVINSLGENGIRKQLHDAEMNHCLSFEQVSDEVIEEYNILPGSFDTISDSPYKIPGFQDIGRLYFFMITDCAEDNKEVQEMIKLFNSFISDEISDFRTDVFYQNLSYLECCYKEGHLLD